MQVYATDPIPICAGRSTDWPHLAAVQVHPIVGTRSADSADEEKIASDGVDWIAACYRLTPRVERTGPWSALLDLGTCTDTEAVTALRDLGEWLAIAGLRAWVGIGPSGVLAQLAEKRCTPDHPIALLVPSEAPAILPRVPVSALLVLRPRGLITLEIVERLQGYGLHTLGHIARVGELALRRQFGTIGSFLAAVAQGHDARPLCPTPPPPILRIRQCFAAPATSREVLALLPHLAERVVARLRIQGRQVRSLRLVVRWEDGGIERSRLTLRQYSDSPTLLAQELRRLLLPLLTTGCIEELWLTLADFAPATPAQATFWRTRQQQVAVIEEVAATLARRHGRPVLLQPQLAIPAAVFSEERYAFGPPGVIPGVIPDTLGLTGTEDVANAGGRVPRHRDHTRQSAPIAPLRAESMEGMEGIVGVKGDDMWQGVPQRLHWW